MLYKNIISGKFISRPNRFIAYVEIDGKREVCHVKNTGRCEELLISGAHVYVHMSDNPHRKTKYDLISVYKGDKLINIDSGAPNKVFAEWVKSGKFFKNLNYIKPEYKYKNSRFDFYIEAEERRILVEVKGVTLEKDGVASFPDAPTKRGVKHINELVEALNDGYEAYVFFVVQMADCDYFAPNRKAHREFADAVACAARKGVIINAVKCDVGPHELKIREFVRSRI